MIRSVLYFDYDDNFVCHYSISEDKPLLKGVYSNALYNSLKDFHNSNETKNDIWFDECVAVLTLIPYTLFVVGSASEGKNIISKSKKSKLVTFHRKNRLHYGTEDIHYVVSGVLKEYMKKKWKEWGRGWV